MENSFIVESMTEGALKNIIELLICRRGHLVKSQI